ncbi:hypothetical protein BXY64_0497 [Marinifilum flexuosum]|uniref:Uncharacterized protein n=1 Tax=Marinifilum flexuosum TaxID=1117708 RepID=A0A419X702_9BACT|nr:hypothetical protein BXY64_0497 [Marinifilum flexuosum]
MSYELGIGGSSKNLVSCIGIHNSSFIILKKIWCQEEK